MKCINGNCMPPTLVRRYQSLKEKQQQKEKNAPSVPLRVRLVRFRFRGSVGSSICKSADALLLALPG